MSKRLEGGIIGCKDKTSSWNLNGFPDGSNIGSTVSYRGEAHRYTSLCNYSVVSHIQRIGCQLEKNTLFYTVVANPARGLLNRENITKRESLAAPPPLPPPNAARSEKMK